jgi:hypothetical protein
MTKALNALMKVQIISETGKKPVKKEMILIVVSVLLVLLHWRF